ncbi:sulfurtransferase [Alteromonas gilva]|uniref:Sulfurtransferase n=1 Tax=Alteromonas gilva TaxID=2987522 RepID=A0ABT5L253_9ALTE|nr:rhodanese-like domain-containing protein [Alteromonas gilva]MDC8831115.1 rhodanese-like domain-containing protein [Alteromonas gilva]
MPRLISVNDITPDDLSSYVVLFASMTNPVSGKADDPNDGFLPGAVKFDLDGEGSDHTSPLPHTLPAPDKLAAQLGRLGIENTSHVLIYDNLGMFCAPRVWWMLKSLGHKNVKVLNGGLPAWKAAGYPVSSSLTSRSPATYQPVVEPTWFCNSDKVLKASESASPLILDARSAGRFNGTAPEPREGLRSGHMPGAYSVPFGDLLDVGLALKPADKLKAFFNARNIDLSQPIICSCGSGVTACVVGIAALEAGATNVTVYDGSWSEWGGNHHLPVENANV